MKGKNIIIIDLDKWMTQQEAANTKGCTIQYINKCIKNGKLKSFPIPQINVVLVERIN